MVETGKACRARPTEVAWRETLYAIAFSICLCGLLIISFSLSVLPMKPAIAKQGSDIEKYEDYAEHASTLYRLVGVFATMTVALAYRKFNEVVEELRELREAYNKEKEDCFNKRIDYLSALNDKVDWETFNAHTHNEGGKVMR
jgi:hypothetical protein